MSPIVESVLGFFRKLKLTTVVTLLAVAFCILWLQQCESKKSLSQELALEKQKNDQNLSSMTEGIKVIKKLNGDFEASKASYMGSLEEIKKYNASLYDRFNDQKGLLAGIYSNLSIRLDSLISRGDTLVRYTDSTYGISFYTNYEEKDLRNEIYGITQVKLLKNDVIPMSTVITSNEMQIGISYGFRNLKDRYEIFAISKSPNVKFNELEGMLTINKDDMVATPAKKLKWGLGFHVGVTYSITQKAPIPYVGAGLSYNIINF